MTHEQDNIAAASQAVVPVDPLAVLPLRVNQEGNTVTDWGELVKMESSPELVAAMIGSELIRLSNSEDQTERLYAQRLQNNIEGIIKIYDTGLLPGMRDVHEITSLVMERNPRLSDVARMMTNRGYTAEGTAYLYDVRDTLGLTLDQTDTIFKTLGFRLDDDQDVSLVDSALEIIEEVRELKFRHTAAEVLTELIDSGVSLTDIIDGRVY